MTLFSRRELIRSSGLAMICLLAPRIPQLQPTAATRALKVSLTKEFPKRRIIDISPDGVRLCLENWSDAKYPLEVAETGTWEIIFDETFQTRVRYAGFFSDSRTLIAETRIALSDRKIVPHLTLVDLQTGERTEGQYIAGNPYAAIC